MSGITPACAGKSARGGRRGRGKGDHPRVRGEKQKTGFLILTFQGSPPRARGKAGLPAVRGGVAGITPACAGKRRPWPPTSPKS